MQECTKLGGKKCQIWTELGEEMLDNLRAIRKAKHIEGLEKELLSDEFEGIYWEYSEIIGG